jgi:biotin synthase
MGNKHAGERSTARISYTTYLLSMCSGVHQLFIRVGISSYSLSRSITKLSKITRHRNLQLSAIPIERRLKTLRIAKEIGLGVGTCLEPVGPEHTTGELVKKLLITRDCEPAYSGSARRIPIPGTELARKGVVSEAAMAHILAVVRMVLPLSIKGNCTHEPNSLGAAAGANLLWAEVGANPRDTRERAEESRGLSVPRCREVLEGAEWNYLEGPSAFYRAMAR